MKLEEVDQSEVISSGVVWSAGYGIDEEDLRMLFVILRSSLYSNKIQAVLREYMSNGWDEHMQTGQGDKPIKVVLPTHLNPTLIIRDYGRGLSHEQIDKVYRKYMKSLKRDTNDPIGSFGIGAKVAFAYSDTFSITSHHMGMQRVYVGIIANGGVGDISQHGPARPTDETGIEIQVPVNPDHIWKFHHEARRLFPFFEPTPECNINLGVKTLAQVREESAQATDKALVCRPDQLPLDTSRTRVWAKMGPVVYPVDMDQVRDKVRHKIPENRIFLLDVPIGSIAPHPSREALEYTDKTVKTLVAQIDAYVDALLAAERKKWAQMSMWNRRQYADDVFERTGFELGPRGKLKLTKEEIEQIASLATLQRVRNYWDRKRKQSIVHVSEDTEITTKAKTHLYVHNATKLFRGYVRGSYDVDDGTTLYMKLTGDPATLRPQVEAVLEGTPLAGIPISFTSEMTYTNITQGRSSVSLPQHKARYFTFNGGMGHRMSSRWDVNDAPPGDGDVFVIIERFTPVDMRSFFSRYETDSCLADMLGIEMPEVLAVKNTESKPAHYDDYTSKGAIDYRTWSKRFREWIQHEPKIRENARLAHLPDHYEFRGHSSENAIYLGEDHPIYVFLRDYEKAREEGKRVRSLDYEARYFLKSIKGIQKPKWTERLQKLREKYPLFWNKPYDLDYPSFCAMILWAEKRNAARSITPDNLPITYATGYAQENA